MEKPITISDVCARWLPPSGTLFFCIIALSLYHTTRKFATRTYFDNKKAARMRTTSGNSHSLLRLMCYTLFLTLYSSFLCMSIKIFPFPARVTHGGKHAQSAYKPSQTGLTKPKQAKRPSSCIFSNCSTFQDFAKARFCEILDNFQQKMQESRFFRLDSCTNHTRLILFSLVLHYCLYCLSDLGKSRTDRG